nr:EamA family transporter [Actinomadura rugatobispora]
MDGVQPRHAGLAAVVVVIWGVNFVIIDVALREFPPLLLAALRFALTAVPAILFVRRPPVAWRWIVAVGFLLGVGNFGLLFLGINLGMPAGLSSLVLQSQAMFTLLMAAVLVGERLGRRHVAGTAVATAGLVLIAAGGGDSVPLGPFLLVVASAVCWAAANVCTRASGAPAGLGLLVWSSVIPPLPLAALSYLVEGHDAVAGALTSFEPGATLALAYLVALATLVGFGTWNTLLRHYPAGLIAPFSLAVPVVGMSAAWVWLGERPGAAELGGAAVILLGLALVVRPPRRARAVPPPVRHQEEARAP